MPVIYLDMLFAVNWFIDTLLLSVTARITRTPYKRWRLVASGAVGAVFACLMFLWAIPRLLTAFLHIVCAVLLVLISFSSCKVRQFCRQVFVLYISSALFSGIVTVLWQLTASETFYAQNGVVYVDISPLTLSIFAVISYVAISIYEWIMRRRMPCQHDYILTVDDGYGACECRALYDTGLHLTEPFSGKSAVIVELDTVSAFVPNDVLLSLTNDVSRLPDYMATRVRVVPYRSIGAEGLLPAFLPKRLSIRRPNGPSMDISGTYVAVIKTLGRGEYRALVGNDSVQGEL